ncbi:MAG: amidohydrolase family protein [Planctomycetota bacterium]|jgi:imidazolonepropionase-like amidohydrolase|nr:amidohydrolase family protein [Planctomycetota bacterium]
MILNTLLLASSALLSQQASQWAVDTVHLGDGQVLHDVLISINDGKITAVAEGAVADDAQSIAGAHLTPGLIDAYSYMGVDGATLEESRESTASIKLSSSLKFDAPSFSYALDEGVTSAYLSPASRNVIGGLGCVVKTHGGKVASLFGETGSAARMLNDAAALKITLGGDPSMGNHTGSGKWTTRFTARRPTTRMGTVWVVRREFYRALEYSKLRDKGQVAFDGDLEVLTAALSGDLLVRVQAREAHDVETALRLQEEFGWPRMVIEEATKSHKISSMIAREGVPVVTGPAYDSASRAIANGPSAAELAYAAEPGQICCEDYHAPGEEHVNESGKLELNDFALSLLPVVAPRYEAAPGLARGRRSEASGSTPALPALLADANVKFAMGSAESHDSPLTEASLIYQARRAVRWGLDESVALTLITSVPAKLCGYGKSLGQIKAGFDADLVLWSGDPLDPTSIPLVVIVDGQVVVDNR